MGMPSARIGDMHVCPAVCPGPAPHVGGPIVSGAGTVMVTGIPAARLGDSAVCACAGDSIASGSGTVMIEGKPAARIGDSCGHGGAVVAGAPTVLIG
ncbi:PAAR domain-containing protein [Saprospira sp. CCB-QB6]|uniref:PAAR domain-containing protein n=1 Tax=Saprospira sp. CCB-QB6 TaxID=3023936 RepID=UPI00234B9572|nr:PAAR domain-containing protein [Saprospira sp. CCB-QB6]WCL82401.1 PAAR domain-containing protein [Saprospira sp. CCB-QB6]